MLSRCACFFSPELHRNTSTLYNLLAASRCRCLRSFPRSSQLPPSMCLTQGQTLGWTSGHILILFTGEERSCLVPWREGGQESSSLLACAWPRQTGDSLASSGVDVTISLLFPDLGKHWSQDHPILCWFPSTGLQLPPSKNSSSWTGSACHWPCVLSRLCALLLWKQNQFSPTPSVSWIASVEIS